MPLPTAHARFATLCNQKGIKLTGQRLVISEILCGSLDHPSADQIYRKAVARHPRISLATVYRTLRLFRDAGLVIEQAFQDDRCHYELASDPRHDHLLDVETGAIVEFRDPEIERLEEAIAARLGYRLTGHRLELYGTRAS